MKREPANPALEDLGAATAVHRKPARYQSQSQPARAGAVLTQTQEAGGGSGVWRLPETGAVGRGDGEIMDHAFVDMFWFNY